MCELYNILAIFCLIYSSSFAKNILLPPDMQSTTLFPETINGSSISKWNVKACDECKIIASCQFLTAFCNLAKITLNTGDGILVKCPNVGRQFLVTSKRNFMSIEIENNGIDRLSTCSVKSTIPYIDKPEPPEPNSLEFGLENKGKRRPTCRCGWTNKSPQRIVNGTHASLHEFPFIVRIALHLTRQGFCGGSIITNRHILTAAHCTVKFRNYPLYVIVGEHDVSTTHDTSETREYDVLRIISHDDYNRETYLNDISILLLKDVIKFNDVIGPVCLPIAQQDLIGQYIKVMGWGRTADRTIGGQLSPILSKVNLVVVEPNICEAVFLILPLRKSQICTFRYKRDSCSGDSGGPLVWRDPNTNMYTQVALVSYGNKCAETDPAVNTDVAHYMGWIRNVIKVTEPAEVCY